MARSALSLVFALVATAAASLSAVRCERVPPSPQVTPVPARPEAQGPPPLFWEQPIEGGLLVNRGVARIDRIGTRWALSVLCSGTHTTYLDDTTIDLTRFATGYVRARYRWVDRQVSNPRCVQAPCGPIAERRIALDELTAEQISTADAEKRANECRSPDKE